MHHVIDINKRPTSSHSYPASSYRVLVCSFINGAAHPPFESRGHGVTARSGRREEPAKPQQSSCACVASRTSLSAARPLLCSVCHVKSSVRLSDSVSLCDQGHGTTCSVNFPLGIVSVVNAFVQSWVAHGLTTV